MNVGTGDRRAVRSEGDGASLSRSVYDHVRHDIVTGVLRPNERLVEADLAARYSASRTPVREALLRLEETALVERLRSGWCVREQTEQEIKEIYGVRMILEGAAARVGAQLAARGELGQATHTRLIEVARELKELHAPPVPGYIEVVQENETFHDQLIAIADNTRLLRLCRQERAYYFNVRLARLYSDADYQHQRGQHLALVTAVLDGDADTAERIAVTHVHDALQLVLQKVFDGSRVTQAHPGHPDMAEVARVPAS